MLLSTRALLVPTLLAVLVTSGLPTGAEEPQRAAEIRKQIARISKNLDDLAATLGKERTVQTIVRSQPAAQPVVIPLKLKKGDGGTVVAFCNPDCPPVDANLTDAAGKSIADDSDHPATLSYLVEQDGDHTLTIMFKGCKETACDVGVILREKLPR